MDQLKNMNVKVFVIANGFEINNIFSPTEFSVVYFTGSDSSTLHHYFIENSNINFEELSIAQKKLYAMFKLMFMA